MLRRRGLHLQHLQLEQQRDQPDQRADPANPLLQVTAGRALPTRRSAPLLSRSVTHSGSLFCVLARRSEYDGDLQSQLLSKANEEDKNCSRALSVVSAVVRAAKDLLHRAFAVDGNRKIFVAVAPFASSV